MAMESGAVNSVASTAIEGLKRAQEKTEAAAQSIAAGSLDPEDIVSLSLAATEFKANVAVLKTEDEMTGSLLDILA